MDPDHFPEIIRTFAELPDAVERLGEPETAALLRKLMLKGLDEMYSFLPSSNAEVADLLGTAFDVIEVSYVDPQPECVLDCLEYLQEHLDRVTGD